MIHEAERISGGGVPVGKWNFRAMARQPCGSCCPVQLKL
jgi:hypothetical protein